VPPFIAEIEDAPLELKSKYAHVSDFAQKVSPVETHPGDEAKDVRIPRNKKNWVMITYIPSRIAVDFVI